MSHAAHRALGLAARTQGGDVLGSKSRVPNLLAPTSWTVHLKQVAAKVSIQSMCRSVGLCR